MSPTSLLFVYGSLRTGAGHPMHAVLAAAATPWAEGRVSGRLCVVDWYPGLVLGGEAFVHGEVWNVGDAGVWAELDAYEGCGISDAPPHEFVRQSCRVVTAHTQADALVYAYTGSVTGRPWVPGGDWLRHKAGNDRP